LDGDAVDSPLADELNEAIEEVEREDMAAQRMTAFGDKLVLATDRVAEPTHRSHQAVRQAFQNTDPVERTDRHGHTDDGRFGTEIRPELVGTIVALASRSLN
jgi:hypothetical protein